MLSRSMAAVLFLSMPAAPSAAATFTTLTSLLGGSHDGGTPNAPTYESGSLYVERHSYSWAFKHRYDFVLRYNLRTGVTVRRAIILYLDSETPVDPGDLTAVGKVLYGSNLTDDEAGSIFRYDPASKSLKFLHIFTYRESGFTPVPYLAYEDGTLFGTSTEGGSARYGDIYRYDIDKERCSILYTFLGEADGKSPRSLVATGTRLYGITDATDGTAQSQVFTFDATSNDLKILHEFTGGADGSAPTGLVEHAGKLYGTTKSGGANGYGTFFSIDVKTGAVSTLYNFGNDANGCQPSMTPTYAAGMLYGVTQACGASGDGTAYQIDASTGAFTVLHSFTGVTDGASPVGPLTYHAGILYGTAQYGGANGAGTLFEIAP